MRPLIQSIIDDPKRAKFIAKVGHHFPGYSELHRPDQVLMKLPELTSSKRSIDAWTNKLVYPRLVAMNLGDHPIIGGMEKAKDENTKFQISRLKPLIRLTVERIAKVPQSFYFDLA